MVSSHPLDRFEASLQRVTRVDSLPVVLCNNDGKFQCRLTAKNHFCCRHISCLPRAIEDVFNRFAKRVMDLSQSDARKLFTAGSGPPHPLIAEALVWTLECYWVDRLRRWYEFSFRGDEWIYDRKVMNSVRKGWDKSGNYLPMRVHNWFANLEPIWQMRQELDEKRQAYSVLVKVLLSPHLIDDLTREVLQFLVPTRT